MNPQLLDVEAKISSGLWPRSESVGILLAPYLRRMKGELVGLEVNVQTGENSYELLDKCPSLVKMYGIQNPTEEQHKHLEQYNDILTANMKKFGNRFEQVYTTPNTKFDIICLNTDRPTVEMFEKYYELVKSRGIICGNNHHLVNEVRAPIKEFKRKHRIGTNVNIHNEIWFWYKD